MNTFCQKTVAGLGLVITISLSSCQENNLVTPDKPVNESSQAINDIISPNLPKVYTLSKHGDATLRYYPDGRLKSVVHGPDARGNANVRTEYTYSTGLINAISYAGTNLFLDQTYRIDANGRCYEYKERLFIYGNSSLTEKTELGYKYMSCSTESKEWGGGKTTELVYKYNTKGQLQMATDKSNAAVRTVYTYNADGDLSRAIHYGIHCTTSAVAVESDYTFAYDQPTGDPILADHYALNSSVAGFPDPYLKIFGTPGNHLVKLVTVKSSLGGKYYTYTLNEDGYVTKRNEYAISSGVLVETKSYDYLVANLTLQL